MRLTCQCITDSKRILYSQCKLASLPLFSSKWTMHAADQTQTMTRVAQFQPLYNIFVQYFRTSILLLLFFLLRRLISKFEVTDLIGEKCIVLQCQQLLKLISMQCKKWFSSQSADLYIVISRFAQQRQDTDYVIREDGDDQCDWLPVR